MPASPSISVIALRTDAVFKNAGSWLTRPSGFSAVARIAPSSTGTTIVSPVRSSTMLSVSDTGSLLARMRPTMHRGAHGDIGAHPEPGQENYGAPARGAAILPTPPPSTSGLGHHPFKVAARVRIPLGASDS